MVVVFEYVEGIAVGVDGVAGKFADCERADGLEPGYVSAKVCGEVFPHVDDEVDMVGHHDDFFEQYGRLGPEKITDPGAEKGSAVA